MRATGFQLLFLYFAVVFGSMLLGRWALAAFAVPDHYAKHLDQAITFVLAGLILVMAPPLRRSAAGLLAAPVPPSRRREVASVAMLKVVLVFGFVGAVALSGILSGDGQLAVQRFVATDPDRQWALSTAPAMLVFSLLIAAFAGPVLEEIYFRGFLYGAWERQWGWGPASLLTAVAFGLAHPSSMTLTFLSSLLYVGLLRRTGSLRACIYAHCAYNFLVSWPLFGHFLFGDRAGDPLRVGTWSVEIACLAIAIAGVPSYLFLARTALAPKHPRP